MTRVHDEVLSGPHGLLRVRVYAPAAPAGPGLVWAHGGGFAAALLSTALRSIHLPSAH